jgi:hypothetical protein
MLGDENVTWYSSEMAGVVYIVVRPLPKSIMRDMQETLGKNQLNGLSQFANFVITLVINN